MNCISTYLLFKINELWTSTEGSYVMYIEGQVACKVVCEAFVKKLTPNSSETPEKIAHS